MTRSLALKLSFFLFAIVIFGLLTRAASAGEAVKPIHISATELHKMIDDKASFVLIDARRPENYAMGPIRDAINIPADKVNAQSLAEVAPEMDTKLVFYCDDTTCPAGRIAAAKAIGAGYKYVYDMPGGLKEWVETGYQ